MAEEVQSGHEAGWLRRLYEIERKWLELLIAVLLAVASLAAAWSGYQASGWNGVQGQLYSMASTNRLESVRASNTGYLMALSDLALFNGWSEAYARGDRDLLAFYRNRFSPNLEEAVTAWLATNPLENPEAPSGPLEMGAYVYPGLEQANELEAEAARLFDEGQVASEHGDEYVLTTVFLAIVLFFGGISPRLEWRIPKAVILLMAIVLLLYSLARLIALPIA